MRGVRFDKQFTLALSRSTVVLPILSTFAMQRMIGPGGPTADNVLLEWMLILALTDSERLSCVVPIVLGDCFSTGSSEPTVVGIGPMLAWVTQSLPLATCAATVAAFHVMATSISIDERIQRRVAALTVRDVVLEILKFPATVVCPRSPTDASSSKVMPV